MTDFRYPSSRRLLREVLRALGYDHKSIHGMRTSGRVFKDGYDDRATPFSDEEFVKDAFDLMTCSTVEAASRQFRDKSDLEPAALAFREAMQRWDRRAGYLNQQPETQAGGRLAALPVLRLVVMTLGPRLGAAEVLRGVEDPEKLLNPSEETAFNVFFDRLVRRFGPEGQPLLGLHADVSEAVKSATGKGVGRATFDRWRRRPPGSSTRPGATPRFQVHRFVEVLRVIAEGVAEREELRDKAGFADRACLLGRWLLACNRLRGRLDRYLGADSMGHPRVDDLVQALGQYIRWAWEAASREDFVQQEVLAVLGHVARGHNLREDLAELFGVPRQGGAAAQGLFALLQELGEDPAARTPLRSKLLTNLLMVTGASAWLPQVLAFQLRDDTLLCQDYLTSFTDWSGRLAWWHRLLASGTEVEDPRAVDHRRAETVLSMTPAARLRFGVEGGVFAGIDAAVAGSEVWQLVKDHQDQLTRRLWHWALVSAGIPLETVEQATGPAQPLVEGDVYPAYAAACAALMGGDAGAGLDNALDAWKAVPGDPDVVSVLASAFATYIIEEFDADDALPPEAADLARRALTVLRRILENQPEDPGVLAVYAETVLALSGLLDGEEELPEDEEARLVQVRDLLDAGLKAHRVDGRLHHCLALTLYFLDDITDARRHAKEADRLGYPLMWKLMRGDDA